MAEPQGKGGRGRIVLAMTGASGAPYAIRLLQVLARTDLEIHLTISPSGAAVIRQELGLTVDVRRPDLMSLLRFRPAWSRAASSQDAGGPGAAGGPTRAAGEQTAGGPTRAAGEPTPGDPVAAGVGDDTDAADGIDPSRIRCHAYDDYMTPIASGSFRTDAMVVCPCSGSTLSGIARAAAANLIQRAAEVHLKEHRKLVLVPRETPMSTIQLENMHRLALAGAVLLPAMPGWYHDIHSLDCLVDFIVSRILDQLDIDNRLIGRWGET